MHVVNRLICPPKLSQLLLYFRRRDMERLRIVHSLVVPALDRVGEQGCFFQGKAVDQSADLGCRGCVRQSLVRNRADNLVTRRGITVRRRDNSKRKRNYQQQSEKQPG